MGVFTGKYVCALACLMLIEARKCQNTQNWCLQTLISCSAGAWNLTYPLKEQEVLLTAEPSLIPESIWKHVFVH